MLPSEFTLIEKYLNHLSTSNEYIVKGIGDDAAVMQIPEGYQLVTSVDSVNENIHFLRHMQAQDIAYRAVAVALSDLAAMGAKPFAITLALNLSDQNETWFKQLCDGLHEILTHHNISLIGGDITRSESLSLCVQVFGLIKSNCYLARDMAKVGDAIFVTNTLGDAALGLTLAKQRTAITSLALQSYLRPQAQIKIGQALSGLANAAIDISDGLLADLGHILKKSDKGAMLKLENIPLSAELKTLPFDQAMQLALNGGDDYQLCFTISPEKINLLPELVRAHSTCIGEITTTKQWQLLLNGEGYPLVHQGYQHFGGSYET